MQSEQGEQDMRGTLPTTPERSRNMSKIRGRDTEPELAFRKALWAAGLRGYRKNYRNAPGTPDVAFTKHKLAVFVDGEFWHGKDFVAREARLAAGNNGAYWTAKIRRNMERDREQDAALRAAGWTVLRFWAKDVLADPGRCVGIVAEKLEELKRR